MSKRAQEQKKLDAALSATFPASDPVAIGEAHASKPDRPLHRKPAEIDVALVEELARNVGRKHRKTDTGRQEEKTRSFSVDRRGESSAGALSNKDKERAVSTKREGSR